MSFISHSQAGQDRFAYELLVKPDENYHGTFIDVGAGAPVERSNTFALEAMGWIGLLIEQDPAAAARLRAIRRSPVYQEDATQFNYGPWAGETIDYLSLDVDAASEASLARVLESRVRFRVATVEHDAYRFGPGPRRAMREMLKARGYFLIAADVQDQGMAFEDWWVAEPLFKRAERFLESGRDWQYVLSLA